MPAPSPLAPFLEPLERLGLPYCVTGSVAASVYGEPRLTADIDVVLLLQVGDIAALRAAFPDAEYYVPPDETLRLELSRGIRGMFNLTRASSRLTSTSPAAILCTPGPLRIAVESTWRAAEPGSRLPST
jgi:hypothetical protein